MFEELDKSFDAKKSIKCSGILQIFRKSGNQKKKKKVGICQGVFSDTAMNNELYKSLLNFEHLIINDFFVFRGVYIFLGGVIISQ